MARKNKTSARESATPANGSAAPTVDPRLGVEYVDIEAIAGWPGNPKEHDLGAIAESMNRFGFRDPIAVNRANQQIEEGHGRIETLLALRRQGRPAPRFVVVMPDGRWLAPILWFEDDEPTQQGYALAHNRTQELADYDRAKLLEALQELSTAGELTGTGYDAEDIAAIKRKLDAADSESSTVTQSESLKYQVIVDCAGEVEQRDLLERLTSEGLECRALIV